MSSYEAFQKYPEQVERIQELNDKITGGTTAVIALIFNNKLYVANAGDSRAVLCRQVDETSLQVEQVLKQFKALLLCFIFFLYSTIKANSIVGFWF